MQRPYPVAKKLSYDLQVARSRWRFISQALGAPGDLPKVLENISRPQPLGDGARERPKFARLPSFSASSYCRLRCWFGQVDKESAHSHAADRVELRKPGKRWHADCSDRCSATKVPLRCIRRAHAKRRYRRLMLPRPGTASARAMAAGRSGKAPRDIGFSGCRRLPVWLPGGGQAPRHLSGS